MYYNRVGGETEVRKQRSDVRGQKSEVRKQRSDVGNQKSGSMEKFSLKSDF